MARFVTQFASCFAEELKFADDILLEPYENRLTFLGERARGLTRLPPDGANTVCQTILSCIFMVSVSFDLQRGARVVAVTGLHDEMNFCAFVRVEVANITVINQTNRRFLDQRAPRGPTCSPRSSLTATAASPTRRRPNAEVAPSPATTPRRRSGSHRSPRCSGDPCRRRCSLSKFTRVVPFPWWRRLQKRRGGSTRNRVAACAVGLKPSASCVCVIEEVDV